MKNLNRKYIVWGIRIVISILFIVSAIAKLYPSPLMGISSFEIKYLSAIGIDGSFSVILSRLLIGFEFTLGLLILLPYYLKRIVIPSTIALLSAFSIHLFIQVVGGDSSNCGCFGELIPMTPIQALIKNILSIGVLSLLLTSFKHEINDQKNIHPILYSGLIICLLMFILLPQGSSNISRAQIKSGDSIYAQYFPNVAEGNKLVCFFAPTCPHCLETAKQLVALKQKFPGLIPELKIIFMDESWPIDGSPLEIKSFFKEIGAEFDYVSIEPNAFWTIFEAHQKGMEVPGVFYLQGGMHKALYSGSAEYGAENPFTVESLIDQIQKEN
ncbi:MAG: TlpA family protein disulfide reductase [Crocinitomicaceae bacterium]